ncbi:MAG: tetratricopeptide repeat protein [Candidatus Eremiobacterota bacterium]
MARPVLLLLLLLLPLSPWAVAQNPVDGVLAQMLSSDPANWDTILSKNREQITQEQLNGVLKRAVGLAMKGRDREAVQLVKASDYVDYFLSDKESYRGVGQVTLALALLNQGEQMRAGTIAEDLLQEPPELDAAHLLMGKVLLHSNPVEALRHFQLVAERTPTSEGAWEGQGQAYVVMGRADDALKAFRKVLEINPENGVARDVVNYLTNPQGANAPSSNKQAMEHFHKAEAHFAANRLKEALQEYDKAIQADPRFAKAWLFKGDCWFRMGDHDKAITCYRKAIALDPQDFQAYRFLGDVLERKYAKTNQVALLDEAIACYEKALQINPDYGTARVDLERARKKRTVHKPTEPSPP